MTSAVRPYLDKVGKFTVEQVPCPHFSEAVNVAGPRTGVIHTTEGDSIDGALSVFKQHFAPHFLVGPGRVLQLVQVGTIGAALVTHNVDAIVQIEVVGYSKQTPWIFDEATLEPLAALLATCQAEYGVPLFHPWADGDYGLYGENPHRHAGKWGVVAGWFGHGDVPSPDTHWDPGDLLWTQLLARAAALTEVTGAPAWTPPAAPARPCACQQPSGFAAIPEWPPASNPMWARAAQLVNAMRAKGAENPLIVAALANGYAESALTPRIAGDNDAAFSIWQWHWIPRGERILAGTGINVRAETSIARLVDALWWELANVYPSTLAKLRAATTAEDAARIFCDEFEGAGAPNAADRRVAEATWLAVWLSRNEAFVARNAAL